MNDAMNTSQGLTWGKFLKGAAIVTAVVAVAVVASIAVPALINWAGGLITDDTTQTLLSNAWDGLSSAWDTVSGWGKAGGDAIATWWKELPSDFELKNTFSWPGADAVKSAVGPTAGVVAGVAALPAAVHAYQSIDPHTIANHATVNHGMQHAAEHAAHFAAEHSTERRGGFTSRITPKTTSGSFAQAVTPRGASHIDAESLRKSTADLKSELGA